MGPKYTLAPPPKFQVGPWPFGHPLFLHQCLINGIIDQTHVYHFYTYLSVFWTNGNQCLYNVSKDLFLRTLRSEFEIYLALNEPSRYIIGANKIRPHTSRIYSSLSLARMTIIFKLSNMPPVLYATGLFLVPRWKSCDAKLE